MKPIKILSGLIILLGVVSLLALTRTDDDPIKKVVTQLNRWTDSLPQEKVYLHLDKPFYAAGEDIWFKAYVTIGTEHQLSALSRILNVELINERDSVKESVKLPLANGVSVGDFALPDTLRPGNYRIRAYTNYMRNAGEDYFFDRTITIGNAISNKIFTKANYKYSTQNGQQRVDADITYTDLNGQPYGVKEVSYEVQLDGRKVASGKGTTDAAGVLKFGFNNNMPNLMKAGRIVTNIKYEDKKVSTQTVPIKAATNKISVQFFPEGGSLVQGLRSKVAFKAVSADGLGVNVTGTIKDEAGQEVVKFNSTHLGMGSFILVPAQGKTYLAEITNADGSVDKYNLPAAQASGYVMSINNNDADNILLRVVTTTDAASVVSVVAQQNGKVYYAAKSNAGSATFATTVPKNRFATGVVQFTLFNANAEPIAERLVFVNNPASMLDLNVTADKPKYTPRQKVKLDVSALAGGKATLSVLSAAVIDEGRVPVNENKEVSILSTILLTSDLRGYIEQPGYYFIKDDEKTRADLDLLMLTQGYRRFVWKQILNDAFPPMAFQAEKSLSVSGTVTQGKKPVPNAKVMLMSNTGGVFILDTVADAKGHFAFNNLVFKDSVRFVVQARTQKDRKFVDINLDNLAPATVTKNPNAPDVQVSISDTLSRYLQNSHNKYLGEIKYGVGNHVTVLKEVVIKEKKKNDIPNSSNLNGAGGADQVVRGDVLLTCPTLELCLQGRANFVMFRGGQAYSTRSPNTPMLIILDGMQMSEDFTLDNINPADVEAVEVLRTISYTAIYGGRASGGALVITTKRGGGGGSYIRYSPGVITYAPKGYYAARQFYSPDYENNKTNPAMPDLRTTIYWRPNFITDKEGKASLTFFNADAKGTYRVVIEGIDGDGHLGRKVFRYKVE